MSHSSDLTDRQLELIRDIFENKKNYIHKYSKRELINAVFYVIKTGCQWRMLPKDLPKWNATYNFFFRAKNKGLWEQMMDRLVKLDSKKDPLYAIIDSQYVKVHKANIHDTKENIS